MTIGMPIVNVKIYILNKDRNIVETGCVGEIYISGNVRSRTNLGKYNVIKTCFNF
jgi:non-ribosomal peptide synthetase component F